MATKEKLVSNILASSRNIGMIIGQNQTRMRCMWVRMSPKDFQSLIGGSLRKARLPHLRKRSSVCCCKITHVKRPQAIIWKCKVLLEGQSDFQQRFLLKKVALCSYLCIWVRIRTMIYAIKGSLTSFSYFWTSKNKKKKTLMNP